jgi:hypothetical protein
LISNHSIAGDKPMSEAQVKPTEDQAKPGFSWDAADDNDGGDFLENVTGQAAPKACSLEDAACEACQ